MTQNAVKIKSFFQDTYSQAQNKIVEFAEKAGTSIKDSSTKGRERLEALTNQVQVTEIVDKLKNIEALKPGYLTDLSAQLGISTNAELDAIKAELAALKKEVAGLKNRAVPTKAELEKLRGDMASLAPTPKKTGKKTSKVTPIKATTKKSTSAKPKAKAKAPSKKKANSSATKSKRS